jgi:hypothetical protein
MDNLVAGKHAPNANAGPDQTIILPANSVELNGSGVDLQGNIASYKWSYVEGPSSFTIVNPNNAKTIVQNLVKGLYKFQLTVTNSDSLSGKDEVLIGVWDSVDSSGIGDWHY